MCNVSETSLPMLQQARKRNTQVLSTAIKKKYIKKRKNICVCEYVYIYIFRDIYVCTYIYNFFN